VLYHNDTTQCHHAVPHQHLVTLYSYLWKLTQHINTADACTFDHVTPLLSVNLHWLRVPERIQYELCVLVHRCLNGAAPQYLSELIQPLSDVDSRRRLRSASTAQVLVPAKRRSTIGDCALAIAGPRAWHNLSRSALIPNIFHFQNTPEVTSVQHILPFSLTVS